MSNDDDLDRTVIMPTPGRRQGGAGTGENPASGNVSPGVPTPLVPGQPQAQAPIPGQPTSVNPSLQAGQPAAIHAPSSPSQDNAGGMSLHMVGSSGKNQLVNAATMIFSLARQLRNTAQHQDVDGLLAHVTELVKTYERNCIAAGTTPDVAYEARYIICAFIDEIVLNTPWGASSNWSHNGLLSALHSDTSGGERFFQILARKSDAPGQNLALLELMYHCLRLGFQGKFAVQDNGPAALEQISAGLFKTIRDLKGEVDSDLSPHWSGVSDGRPMVAKLIPWWVVAATLGGLLALTFTGFFFALNDDSDQVFSDIGKLGREVPQMIKSRQVIAPLVDPIVSGVDLSQVAFKLKDFLADEIVNRQASIQESQYGVKLTLHNKGLFSSGSAVVADSHRNTMQKIARALADLPGPIVVSGHSDSQKIRTLRFPSNWHLSDERARAIVTMLVEAGMQRTRLVAQGKAETEPVASNDTAEGREQNRRIEILVKSF